ncbi:MAG TPA: hypothetical protein VHY57_08915 [Rhizomicrobium sp.]|nr:hypothetical protein [Rhizomicrobium sp.]
MLVAIKFDDQFCLEARKIHDIRSDRLLAAEFKSGELPAAQEKPQPAFGIGLPTTQQSGECVLHPVPLTSKI